MSYPPSTSQPSSPAPTRPYQSPSRTRRSSLPPISRERDDELPSPPLISMGGTNHSHSNSMGASGQGGMGDYRTSADVYASNGGSGGGNQYERIDGYSHNNPLSNNNNQQQFQTGPPQQSTRQGGRQMGDYSPPQGSTGSNRSQNNSNQQHQHIRMVSNSSPAEFNPLLSNNNNNNIQPGQQQFNPHHQPSNSYSNNNQGHQQQLSPPLSSLNGHSEMGYLDSSNSSNNSNNNNNGYSQPQYQHQSHQSQSNLGVGYPNNSNNINNSYGSRPPGSIRGISDSYSAYSDQQPQSLFHPSNSSHSFNGGASSNTGGGGGGDNESQRGLYGTMNSTSNLVNQSQQQYGNQGRRSSNLNYNNYNDSSPLDNDHELEKTSSTDQLSLSHALPGEKSTPSNSSSKQSRRLTRSNLSLPPGNPNGKKGYWAGLPTSKKRCLIITSIIFFLLVAGGAGAAGAILAKNAANRANGATRTTSAKRGIPTGLGGADWTKAAYGGDGSLVFLGDGSKFVYNNTFGGYWNSIPFNDTAQAQADVPPLNQPWDYNVNLVQGVNLGGWLVIEPFIVPGLFEPFDSTGTTPSSNASNPVVDEWTLCLALGTDMVATITNHYETFITEKDFAEIAGAGLNWVRIPIPYWAIEVYPGEPFLANVAWTYFLKAIVWARKYGLRINLDLHAVPGSQNGYNHSSKLGTINFLNGVMGIANAQRTLNYIRTLTEFISQPQYSNVIPMFSVLNEPYAATIGVDTLRHFYMETYSLVRNITGLGESNGPMIVFHDGFVKAATNVSQGGWDGFMPGADRVAIDQHPYLCFAAPNNDGLSYQAAKPCAYWATGFNTSSQQFGLSMGAEWSLAINDCGKWVNNVGNGARFDGTYYQPGNTSAPQYTGVGSCDVWNNWDNYTDATKEGLKLVAQGHQDALRHWFFWTWKTGYSTTLGKIANPLWNYQLALENGFMPKDPRAGSGACTSLISLAGPPVSMVANPAPSLSAWMTGGVGAGTLLNLVQSAQFGAWPPSQIGSPTNATPVAFLPTYTATEAIITLPASAPTAYPTGYSSVTGAGNGWNQPNDNQNYFTPVSGCNYPNPWFGVSATVPLAVCTGAGTAGASGNAIALASVFNISAISVSSTSSSSTTSTIATSSITVAPVAPVVAPVASTTVAPVAPVGISFPGLVPITSASRKRRGYETHFVNVPGPTQAP